MKISATCNCGREVEIFTPKVVGAPSADALVLRCRACAVIYTLAPTNSDFAKVLTAILDSPSLSKSMFASSMEEPEKEEGSSELTKKED